MASLWALYVPGAFLIIAAKTSLSQMHTLLPCTEYSYKYMYMRNRWFTLGDQAARAGHPE